MVVRKTKGTASGTGKEQGSAGVGAQGILSLDGQPEPEADRRVVKRRSVRSADSSTRVRRVRNGDTVELPGGSGHADAIVVGEGIRGTGREQREPRDERAQRSLGRMGPGEKSPVPAEGDPPGAVDDGDGRAASGQSGLYRHDESGCAEHLTVARLIAWLTARGWSSGGDPAGLTYVRGARRLRLVVTAALQVQDGEVWVTANAVPFTDLRLEGDRLLGFEKGDRPARGRRR